MYKKGFSKFLKFGTAKFVFFSAMTILFVFVFGNVIMFLWNWILPDAIGANKITFWKAVGLFVLTRVLFGGFKGGHHRRRQHKGREWKERWRNLSEEEKVEFKEKWKGDWRSMSREEKNAFKQKWKDEFRDSL